MQHKKIDSYKITLRNIEILRDILLDKITINDTAKKYCLVKETIKYILYRTIWNIRQVYNLFKAIASNKIKELTNEEKQIVLSYLDKYKERIFNQAITERNNIIAGLNHKLFTKEQEIKSLRTKINYEKIKCKFWRDLLTKDGESKK